MSAAAEAGAAAAHGAQVRNHLVFRALMIPAVLVVLLRLLAPFEVGNDQATQLEAAQRLVAGLGITTTNSSAQSPDLSVPVEPKWVTWWPPGASLIFAGFLALGLPLVWALKIPCALATLAGWYGWATLAGAALPPPGAGRKWLYVSTAAMLPLIFTGRWGFSDLFLWAGLPWFVLLLTTRRYAAAGLLAGVLFAIRYASVFLLAAGACFLLYSLLPRWKPLVRNAVVFGLCAALIAGPVVLYVKAHSQSAVPGVVPDVAEEDGEPEPATRLSWVLLQWPALWNLLPGASAAVPLLMKSAEPVRAVAGAAAALFMLLLPLAAMRYRAPLVVVAASYLPAALTLLLSILSSGFFLSIRRYYEPAILATVLVVFWLALSRQVPGRVRWLARGAAVLVIAHVFVVQPLLGWNQRTRWRVVNDLFGYIPPRQSTQPSTSLDISYPGPSTLFTRKEATRRRIRELARQHPDALFFIQQYGSFVYDRILPDGPEPGRRMRVMPREFFWRQAYTPLPVKIFWVLESRGKLEFVPEANRKVVYDDEFERSRILESDFPAGYRFGDALSAR